MEEGLGAEVRFVPELVDHNRRSGRAIKTFDHRVVESFQRSGPDARVPNDVGNEPHDGHDGVRIHRPIEHPGDALRIQHVPIPVGLLVEQGLLLVGRIGHEQRDVDT